MLMHQNVFSFIIIVFVSVEYINECNGYHLIPPPSPYNNLTRFKRQAAVNVTSVLPATGECPSPVIENGKYEILGNDQHASGDPIPNFSVVIFSCSSDNYSLTTTYNLTYCRNGTFLNELPKCNRLCSAIFSTSIDVVCELNGVKIDCSKKVPQGTIATMKCKPHYVVLNADPPIARCFRGSWNRQFNHCVPECGVVAPKAQILIASGTIVKKGDFPWHVAIYRREPQNFIYYLCGGSIISEKFVLSAALCFTSYYNGSKLHPTSEYFVAAGKIYNNWDAPQDANFVQKRKISKIEIPKDYLGSMSNFFGDIAVVVVEDPFILTYYVKPVCVDWNSEYVKEQLTNGVLGKVAGWGPLETAENMLRPVLKQLTFPFVELNQCINEVPINFQKFLTNDKYCAGYRNGTNLCQGDAGGGMVFQNKQFEKYYIQGIVSLSPAAKDGQCDFNQFTIYTKVNSYISFLRNVETSNYIIDEKIYENKKPEDCLPPVIQNGNYRLITNEFYTYTSQKPIPNYTLVNITCINTNYILSTSYSTIYCVEGNFSQEIPKCVLTCTPKFPTSIDVDCKLNGIMQDCTKEVREGTIAHMKCKPNFFDKNPEISNITCTKNGIWDGLPKQCSFPYMCPPRLSTAIDVFCELNGVIQDCNKEVPDGTIARMECKKNYIDVKNGPSIAFCSNGAWSLPPKKCIPDCEKIVHEGQTHIINGSSANRGDFPWHVAIYRQKPEELIDYKCGGSIISVKTVITAAHCLTDANNGNIYPVSEYFVAAGKKYSKWDATEDEYYVQTRNVIKIHTPRDVYFGQLSSYAGDIAIVVVEQLFNFTNFIIPVCVDWNSEYVNQQLTNGTLGKIAGWGSVTTGNPIASPNLKQLIIPYVRRDECVKIVPQNFIPFVTVDKYCAGYTNGLSVCGGDSGGGMVFPRHNDYGKKKYYIQGVISAGPTKDGHCDDKQLGVYTKVSNYITFITEIEESNRV